MCSLFCEEVTAYSHLVSFRYVLFQNRIIIYTFWYEIIAACNYLIAIFKLDVHDDIFFSLVHINFQLAAFFCHEVTAYSHYIAFWHILFQYGIVLYAFRYKIVTAAYNNIAVFEENVHDNCRIFFFNSYIQVCTFFCHEVTAFSYYIAFWCILI